MPCPEEILGDQDRNRQIVADKVGNVQGQVRKYSDSYQPLHSQIHGRHVNIKYNEV